MNILFTSISKKVSLVKAFKEALRNEELKGNIIGIDIYKYSAAFFFCDDYYICPRLDSDNYIDYVLDLCKSKEIDLIIPTRDEDVKFFAIHRELFNENGILPLVPSIKTANICEDKFKFHNFLDEYELPGIKTWNKIDNNIIFPCIVKDRLGAGARNFSIVNNFSQLKKSFARIENPIIQEYVEGTEYTIDYFADFDSNPISVVPRIRVKVEGGESKVGLTKNDKELIKLTKKLAQKLKLIGHNVIQCFKNDREIKYIEVNPRFGGGSNLSFAAGAHTPTYLIRLLNGREINFNGFKNNYLMLRYSKDFFIEYDKINNF